MAGNGCCLRSRLFLAVGAIWAPLSREGGAQGSSLELRHEILMGHQQLLHDLASCLHVMDIR